MTRTSFEFKKIKLLFIVQQTYGVSKGQGGKTYRKLRNTSTLKIKKTFRGRKT